MFTVKVEDKHILKWMQDSPEKARKAMSEALKMTGGHLRKKLRSYIESGGENWPALRPMTIELKRKGGATGKAATSPLYNLAKFARYKYSGGFIASQKVQIGFFDTKKLSSRARAVTGRKYRVTLKESIGMTPQSLAAMHEKGKRRLVTEEMRRGKAAMGYPIRRTTKYITIPARPMISRIWAKEARSLPAYLAKRFYEKFF